MNDFDKRRLMAKPFVAPANLFTDLSQYLMSRPTPNQLCRFLVLHMPWPSKPKGAVVAMCQDDAHLNVIGSFGFDKALVASYSRIPLFSHTPLTDAITGGEPVLVQNEHDLSADYDGLRQELESLQQASMPSALAAVPLTQHAVPMGACGITLDQDRLANQHSVDMLVALSPLLSLYLSISAEAAAAESAALRRTAGLAVVPDESITPVEAPLTRRQLRVLDMLGNGMSNNAIAEALDYSVSTIRLDTTAIYRKLGVSGRREAVQEARARGWLTAR